MDPGVAAFDPNDLISYSPEGTDEEGEPPPTDKSAMSVGETASPQPQPKSDIDPLELAAISGEVIQVTVPSISRSGLVHLRSPLQGARFKCKFCPTYTHTPEDFIKHFIMHFGRNRISYKQMSHEEVRLLKNADQKFVCGICASCFDIKEAVKEHMIKDHGFKEAKKIELQDATPSTVGVTATKRKLDDEFIDPQKLPLSDSSSSGLSDEEESKINPAPLKACTPVLSAQPSNTTAVKEAVIPTSVANPSIDCDGDTPKSTAPCSQTPDIIKAASPQHDPNQKQSNDDDLNEYLQPMSLKTLKLKLLAGLKLKCPQKGCVYKFETRAKRDVHLKCHNVEPALIGPGGPLPSPAGGNTPGRDEKKDNFKCYQCGLEFPRWRECSQHLWKQHQVDVNMLKCPVCDVRFDFAVKVYRHLQTHRPVKAYGCSSCSKSFATQSQLSVHESLHKKQKMQRAKQKSPATGSNAEDKEADGATENNDHDAEDEDDERTGQEGKSAEKLPWYAERKCDICGHMFSTSKILSKHIKTVHHKIKPFICSVCGYKSARKVTLTIHMRQHSGQKPLECKECSFRTADPSALKYHEKRHTKDKWYECKFCGLLTIQASALKTHIRLNHPKEYESIKCDLCNFSSVNPELLARHKSDHKAGLIKSEDSRDSVSSKRSKNAPESSSDCFLPIESTDSVVHDAGGFTIPAVINAPVAHSEETQFPT